MRAKIKYILIMSLAFFLFSCGEYELLEQQKHCKKKADSLYRAHRDSLAVTFDSLCTLNQDRYYQQALDSLTKTRMEDIRNLIKK